MADRWWVNDDSDGDWNNADNWSDSEGGAGGSGVPTSSDNAFFSATSSNDNCTCSGAAVCLNIYTASADTGGTDNYTGTIDINDQTFGVSGNAQFESACTISAGNNTWTVAGNMHAEICTFNNNSGTITLTGASKTIKFKNYSNNLANLNITGTYSLVDSKYITIADGICTISGTLSGNGQLITNSPGGQLKVTGTGSVTCQSVLINSQSKISQMDGTISVFSFTVLNTHLTLSSIVPATYTASNSISFSIQSSSLTLELLAGTYTLNAPELNIINQDAGVYTIGNNVNNPSLNINGNISFINLSSGSITWTKGTGTITLSGSSGTQTINFNSKSVENITHNHSGAIKQYSANVTTATCTFSNGTVQSSVAGTQRMITVTNTSAAANTTFKDISMGSANKINAKAAGNVNQGNCLGIVFNDYVE